MLANFNGPFWFDVRRLVPVFCARYLGAGGAGVRRACLSLVRKMVHYAPAALLRALSAPRAAHLLTHLVANVLDNQVNHFIKTYLSHVYTSVIYFDSCSVYSGTSVLFAYAAFKVY